MLLLTFLLFLLFSWHFIHNSSIFSVLDLFVVRKVPWCLELNHFYTAGTHLHFYFLLSTENNRLRLFEYCHEISNMKCKRKQSHVFYLLWKREQRSGKENSIWWSFNMFLLAACTEIIFNILLHTRNVDKYILGH